MPSSGTQQRAPTRFDTKRKRRRRRVAGFRATVQWRRNRRLPTLRRVVVQTVGLRWSSTLINVLLDELIVGDELEELVGPTGHLPRARYAQAVAVALALRYSYREDLLRSFVRRLHRGTR
jgi:hypothetical protein